MDLKRLAGLLPVVGAAFRDKDETKSEYDVAMGAIAACAAIPDVAPWIRVVCAAGIGAVYIVCRTMKKNAEAKAS